MAHEIKDIPVDSVDQPSLTLVSPIETAKNSAQRGEIVKFISPTNLSEAASSLTPKEVEQGQGLFRRVSREQEAEREKTILQYIAEVDSGKTPEAIEQGQIFFDKVITIQEAEREEEKLQNLENHVNQLKNLYRVAERHASHSSPNTEIVNNKVITLNGTIVDQEDVARYSEAYEQKRARTVAALFQLHDIEKLPQEEKEKKLSNFQNAWPGEADEFINVYRTLGQALELVKQDEAFIESHQKLTVIDLIASTYQKFKDASYADIRRKFIADKEKTEAEKEFDRRKGIVADAEEILNKPDIPEEQQLQLFEITGNTKREAELRKTKVKVAWALTAAFTGSAELGGIGASAIGLTHPFVPNIDHPLGVAAFIASYIAYYGVSYFKARRNLVLMHKSGWSNSGPAASAFHHSDGVLSPKNRDKLTIGTDVGYYAFWDLLYGTEALAHAAATVAANMFGVVYTAGLQILPTEAVIRAADLYNNYQNTQKIKRGEPLDNPEDYRRQRILQGSKDIYRSVEYRNGPKKNTSYAFAL